MKLCDFILLDEEKKTGIILHQGVLIAKRNHSTYMVFLFQLDKYYVEMYCDKESKAVDEFRISLSMQSLTPYLETISINDLLE